MSTGRGCSVHFVQPATFFGLRPLSTVVQKAPHRVLRAGFRARGIESSSWAIVRSFFFVFLSVNVRPKLSPPPVSMGSCPTEVFGSRGGGADNRPAVTFSFRGLAFHFLPLRFLLPLDSGLNLYDPPPFSFGISPQLESLSSQRPFYFSRTHFWQFYFILV